MSSRPRPRRQRPALVLPGPAELTPEQRSVAYAAWDEEDVGGAAADASEASDDQAWRAWCAEQVAAGTDVAADPFVAACAALHWDGLRDAAAERARVELAAQHARDAEREERSASLAAFAAWFDAADDDGRARAAAARAQHAQVVAAAAHLDDVRDAQRVLGAAQGAQLRTIAAMAVIHHCAVLPPDAPPAALAAVSPDGLLDAGGELVDLGGVHELVAELAPALAWTPGTTARRVRLAPRVIALMPHTLGRLDTGQIDLDRAVIAATATSCASAAVTRRVDELLFAPGGSGAGLSSTALRAEADRVVAVVDPAAVRRRSRARTTARSVTLAVGVDGMSTMTVCGPTTALVAVHDHLTRVAAANRAEARAAARAGRVAADGGDPYAEPGVDTADPERAGDVDALLVDRRTLNAHRVDALVSAVAGARPADPGSFRPGPGLELHISVLASAGLSDDPGHLEGSGTVPAWQARAALRWASTLVRRVSADPFTGDLIAVDGHVHPASWLTDLIRSSRDDPDPPGGPGPAPGAPGPGPAGPGPAPGASSRGLPVQHLPPPRTEDEALGPPLTPEEVESLLTDGGGEGGDDDGDRCAAGLCTPVDPADCPLAAVGGGPYVPGAAQARHLQRLWGSCTGPGSTVRAALSDLDHVVPHRDDGSGGPTCGCNLTPKSRRWHLTKSATDPGTWTNPADPAALEVPWTRRWEQWQCTDGTAHWTSPLGVSHQVRPRPVAQPAGRYRRVHPVPSETSALDQQPDRWCRPVLGPAGETDLSFPEHPDF